MNTHTSSVIKRCAGAAVMVTMLASCTPYGTLSTTGQGALTGGSIGAFVGSAIGAITGGYQGQAVGSLIGSALGAGVGAAVGSQMQQQQQSLEQQLSYMPQNGYGSGYYSNNYSGGYSNGYGYGDDGYASRNISIQSVKDRNNLDAIRLVLPNAILFEQGSAQLNPSAQATLSRVAYNLNQYPNSDATIVGFSDDSGTPQENQLLSQERANAVMNDLIGAGVAPSRLKAVGDGSSNPIASNTTPEGRAQNRRVEIYITAGPGMIDAAR